MSLQNIIEVKDFQMKFGNHEVIKNLSFEVKKGEVFGLLGSNGSGKTTTLRTLLGLYQPTKGKLLVNGKTFSPETDIKIGYLPEERGLYKKEKVGNIMHYFAELKGLTKTEATKFIEQFLERVGLTDKQKIRLDKLSSGQQQKIQLGITLMGEPDLLILDEPTKGFDPVNRYLLLEIVEEARQRGATVMMITHHMEEAEKLCDRILLLKDGVVKAYGRVEDIKDKAGADRAIVTFNGELPTKNAPFTIENQTKNSAELLPKKDNSIDDILPFLVKNNLPIRRFSIERPSLDEIFVKVYGMKVDNLQTEEPQHA
ncbi:MAG: ATP-binding cassette domain-containing protein [Candidatus Saccharibacteria bacterium]|nr:ATP-binding cassette domain-containing protein [Candidatus Saccharibacteria bacterium]